jgi:hypothetical protein
VIGTGRRNEGLYILDELKVTVVVTTSVPVATTTSVDLSSFCLSSSSSSFYLWHFHLGHVLPSRLRFLASIRALKNLQTCDIFYYSGCKLAKLFALPFNRSIFYFFFSIFCYHKRRVSILCFFFVDDHTCYYWIYLM